MEWRRISKNWFWFDGEQLIWSVCDEACGTLGFDGKKGAGRERGLGEVDSICGVSYSECHWGMIH